ncbi:hypothetical protein [Vibrio vulnificus]|uniref:hypothetical protein n=1 Tax=Vibrio vulnificus TaxID=672 RepID=UPI001F50F45D|nr:hypothetical protein [Vibrio vulnificus]
MCTGMTIGGVAAVSEFSSLQLIFVRLFLSVFYLVILAGAGIHRTASVVARYYRFIASVVVGFALCSSWLWRVYFQTWHPARVDEWIPVCTGMTAGGMARYDEISVSATFSDVLIHFYFPNLNLYIEY